MKIEAKVTALVNYDEISNLLLTAESSPDSQDEHMLCNFLKSRVDFEQGDTVEVTIVKLPK